MQGFEFIVSIVISHTYGYFQSCYYIIIVIIVGYNNCGICMDRYCRTEPGVVNVFVFVGIIEYCRVRRCRDLLSKLPFPVKAGDSILISALEVASLPMRLFTLTPSHCHPRYSIIISMSILKASPQHTTLILPVYHHINIIYYTQPCLGVGTAPHTPNLINI